MLYLTLKTLHIFAAILWVGSFFLICFVTSKNKMNVVQMSSATRITELFIAVTWIAGVVLVIMGSWYSSSWWYLKVFLVVLISAVHSIVHRRWKAAAEVGASTHAAIPFFVLGLTFVVVLLAVFKMPI